MEDGEQEELLYRLDERTERIEEEHLRRLSDVEKAVGSLERQTEANESRIQRNETVLKFMTGGLTAAGAFIAAKFQAILHALRIA